MAVPGIGVVYGARLVHNGHVVAGMALCTMSLIAWSYVCMRQLATE